LWTFFRKGGDIHYTDPSSSLSDLHRASFETIFPRVGQFSVLFWLSQEVFISLGSWEFFAATTINGPHTAWVPPWDNCAVVMRVCVSVAHKNAKFRMDLGENDGWKSEVATPASAAGKLGQHSGSKSRSSMLGQARVHSISPT
jgi:hypothetical protein